MRILHVTSHLDVGGVARHVVSLARAGVARGHQVAIASSAGALAAEAAAGGVALWDAPLRTSAEFSPQVFTATRRLAARLRREPVDLLHAHTRVGQVAAARLARRLDLPYVVTWHGFFRPNLGRRLWPCTGDLTIAISEPVREHLVRDFGVPASRVRLIPHGLDPTSFETPPEPAAQMAFRTQCGVPSGAPVVGTVARLVRSKGVDQLIRAFTRVRAAVPAAHLLIVGDGDARAGLEAIARAEGQADAVHFAGTLPGTALALSVMDLFVFLPAEQEGFGLALLEAMASGRPIVSVRRGGGAAWVLDRDGIGPLVEPADVGALAQRLTEWLRDPAAAQAAGRRAHDVVTRRYTFTQMADAVDSVYRELAGTRVS